MVFSKTEGSSTDKTKGAVDQFSDRSLNYYCDQIPDIKPQLRQLNLERTLEAARENIGVISSAILVGGALSFVLARKFTLASLFLAGLALQAVAKQSSPDLPSPRRNGRERKDIELERYALKAQRGDYGKLEVIAFK